MSEDDWTAADEVIEEVREVRRQLWARFDNDPEKYAAYLQEFYQQLLRDGWRAAPLSDERDKSAA